MVGKLGNPISHSSELDKKQVISTLWAYKRQYDLANNETISVLRWESYTTLGISTPSEGGNVTERNSSNEKRSPKKWERIVLTEACKNNGQIKEVHRKTKADTNISMMMDVTNIKIDQLNIIFLHSPFTYICLTSSIIKWWFIDK